MRYGLVKYFSAGKRSRYSKIKVYDWSVFRISSSSVDSLFDIFRYRKGLSWTRPEELMLTEIISSVLSVDALWNNKESSRMLLTKFIFFLRTVIYVLFICTTCTVYDVILEISLPKRTLKLYSWIVIMLWNKRKLFGANIFEYITEKFYNTCTWTCIWMILLNMMQATENHHVSLHNTVFR